MTRLKRRDIDGIVTFSTRINPAIQNNYLTITFHLHSVYELDFMSSPGPLVVIKNKNIAHSDVHDDG